MAHYVWNSNVLLSKEGIHKLNPQLIGERLETLRAMKGGTLVPQDIIDDAKNAESPLALLYTNSTENDAHEYRLMIARSVIGNVRVVVKTRDEKVIETQYAFVSVRDDDGKRGYVDVKTITETPSLHDRVIEDALRQLLRWQQRYDMINDLKPITKVIKVALKEIEKKKGKKKRGK